LNQKNFDNLQERIDEIIALTNTAVSDVSTISNFTEWVYANLGNLDTEEINSIYKDFIKSNEHIIEKINKIMYFPS
jgi:hypothetical protein